MKPACLLSASTRNDQFRGTPSIAIVQTRVFWVVLFSFSANSKGRRLCNPNGTGAQPGLGAPDAARGDAVLQRQMATFTKRRLFAKRQARPAAGWPDADLPEAQQSWSAVAKRV